MKTPVRPALARLFSDYERLTRDETAALRGHDFASLGCIHALKPAMLAKMVQLSTELGLDRGDEWLKQRLTSLASLESDNERLAAHALREARIERDNFDAARHRLRGLGHAYAGTDLRGGRLFAQG